MLVWHLHIRQERFPYTLYFLQNDYFPSTKCFLYSVALTSTLEVKGDSLNSIRHIIRLNIWQLNMADLIMKAFPLKFHLPIVSEPSLPLL